MWKRLLYSTGASVAAMSMLLLATASAASAGCPNDQKVQRIEVTPKYEKVKVNVQPSSATIYLGSAETVCWEARNLRQGHWIELRRTSKPSKDLEDPFRASSVRLTANHPSFHAALPGAASGGRSWVYDVFVKYTDPANQQTKVALQVDPIVIIKEGGRP